MLHKYNVKNINTNELATFGRKKRKTLLNQSQTIWCISNVSQDMISSNL